MPPEEVKQKALVEIVLGRLGKPEEVASVVVFIAGEGAGYINAQNIFVDGGI